MRICTFILSLLFINSVGFGQNIPPVRIVDWSHVGLIHKISEPELILNVLDYGIVADNTTDNTAAFNSALADLGEDAGIFYFPPGEYLFKNSISISSNVILRGASSDSTKLYFDLGNINNHCITLSKDQASAFIKVETGFHKGSEKLTLKENINLQAGDYIELKQDNGSWDTKPAEWAQNSVGQILSVKRYLNDTIYINSALRLNYDTSLNLVVRKINPVLNSAIECIYIQRTDEPALAGGSNIYFNYAVNCKVSGIESNVSSGSHIFIRSSSNILVEGSYIHHAFKYDGSNTNGYGVTLNQHTGECLIQNNIFKFLRHAMMVKEGANGNVFAYNYSREPNRSEPVSDLSGDISLHGHYPYANLFEGNVVQNIFTDHFWGPAGPNNTFLRNRAELYGISITSDPILETSYQNYIGNELTKPGFPFGNYELNGNDHFEYGNNKFNLTIPENTSNLTVNSLFLDSIPDFWPDDLPWPSIGYPNNLDEHKIPAQLRFESDSSLTSCSVGINDDIIIDPEDPNFTDENRKLVLTPNPFTDEINIHIALTEPQNILVEIFKMNGTKIISRSFESANGVIGLKIYENIPSGNYIIHIKTNEYNFRRIIIKY